MDLNGDGHLDILSGSYSRNDQPMAGLFQVLWGNADGTFKKAAVLNGTDDKPLVIPSKGQDDVVLSICTRPTAVDWDGDGDLDIVSGNFKGTFYLFTGEGRGRFAPASAPILAGGVPLAVHGAHGDPCIVDWDKDGDLDLLSGSSGGGVYLAENTAGGKKTPELKPFSTLIAANTEMTECRPNEVSVPGSATRVWAADMNGDGKLDLLVGDNIALVAPAKGVSEEDFAVKRAAWQKSMEEMNGEFAKTSGDAAANESLQKKWRELYESRDEFMSEERTGFVWLYLQK